MARSTIPITPTQTLWAILALAGLVAVGYPAAHAPDAATFLAELQQSWSSLTVSADLLFLGLAIVAFMIIEARHLGMRWPWIWLPLAVPFPGAFLVPLFFLLRERTMLRRAEARLS